MNKVFCIFLLFFIFSITVCDAQIIDTADRYKPKIFDGYFILLRDSVPESKEEDYSPPRYSFIVFFVKSIDGEILEKIKLNDLPFDDSSVYLAGGTDYNLGLNIEYKEYLNWLIKNKYFAKADESLFDFAKIPRNLLDGDKRFISIYKGRCTVIGPFYPKISSIVKKEKLYMYLPEENKNLSYLYSIIF